MHRIKTWMGIALTTLLFATGCADAGETDTNTNAVQTEANPTETQAANHE